VLHLTQRHLGTAAHSAPGPGRHGRALLAEGLAGRSARAGLPPGAGSDEL